MSTVLHVFPRPTRLFSMRNCWCLIKSLTITITILVLAGHCPRCWIYWAALPIKKENSDLFVQQNCIWSESWKMSACCRFNSWITLNVLSSDFCVSWNIHQNFLPRKYIFLRFNPFKVAKQIVWKFLSWFKVILDRDKNLKSTVFTCSELEPWSRTQADQMTSTFTLVLQKNTSDSFTCHVTMVVLKIHDHHWLIYYHQKRILHDSRV